MSKIRCLVTAGPTREFFDPVRFISNPSTGKMGAAIAEAARDFGWEVSLVLGPSALPRPQGINVENVTSADDMLKACLKKFPACDILIMTAAVSDMRPKIKSPHKVKKDSLSMTVEFEQTPDILKTLSAQKKSQILVGFAAETQNIEAYAKKKLEEKRLDAIAANCVAAQEAGFASDSNAVTLMFKDGERFAIPLASKSDVAKSLVAKLNRKFFNQQAI